MKPHEIVAPWRKHPRFGEIAKRAALLAKQSMPIPMILSEIEADFGAPAPKKIEMRDKAVAVNTWGIPGEDWDHAALDQLYTAARLPVAAGMALMPDAHLGYSLPIGGVAVLKNAVSPAFVGYDIACRMHLSVYNDQPEDFEADRRRLADHLRRVTVFGKGEGHYYPQDHTVMYDPAWLDLPHNLKQLKGLAQAQLGSSGAGNHFADLMVGTVVAESKYFMDRFEVGDQFWGLLTHSGSRGFGHKTASYYMKLADQLTREKYKIQKGYGWLEMDSDPGKEYWNAMQLAGRYAQANHQAIHANFAAVIGHTPVMHYENHHNFAWEYVSPYYIHRKGATPAGLGEIGIIPGSMGTRSFVVEGLGNVKSYHSSSHGAGRVSSRTQAKKNHDEASYQQLLFEKDILAYGVNTDETPQAYKDIERVIELQEGDLVRVIAVLEPRVVVMGGDE